MIKPILKGLPHPPLSEEAVRTAEQVYRTLQQGEKPEKGMIWALAILGNAVYTRAIPLIEGFLGSRDPDIRATALQVLILDFHLPRHCETAWQMLEDEYYEPRRIAAGCLGFCYMGTREPMVLRRLADLVKDQEEHWLVRQGAYRAIFDVLGLPYSHPKRPPSTRAMDFKTEVDWDLIAQLSRGEMPIREI